MQDLTLVMAQFDPLVGDIPGNAERAIEAVREARIEHGADIVVFPELFLTGYPPEDLLLRPSMETRLREARARTETIDKLLPIRKPIFTTFFLIYTPKIIITIFFAPIAAPRPAMATLTSKIVRKIA